MESSWVETIVKLCGGGAVAAAAAWYLKIKQDKRQGRSTDRKEVVNYYESLLARLEADNSLLRDDLRAIEAKHDREYGDLHARHVQAQIENVGLQGRNEMLQFQLEQVRAGMSPVFSPELWTVACIFADETGKITGASPFITLLVHWAPQELIGRPVKKLIPARFHAAHDVGWARAVASDVPPDIRKVYPLFGLMKGGGEIPINLYLTGWREDDKWRFAALIQRRDDSIGSLSGEIPTAIAASLTAPITGGGPVAVVVEASAVLDGQHAGGEGEEA